MDACCSFIHSRLFATHYQYCQTTVKRNKSSSRTDDRFAVLVNLECTFSVTDNKRKIEEIFHRLRKVVWVYDEFEKVDRASSFENILNLKVFLVI